MCAIGATRTFGGDEDCSGSRAILAWWLSTPTCRLVHVYVTVGDTLHSTGVSLQATLCTVHVYVIVGLCFTGTGDAEWIC